ncbi:hypothetical protein J4209_03260 [Candidatus Woesearchaeota archaeon]|nr:hypothetical protein [Candidatus Woesearchaeota archaeon]
MNRKRQVFFNFPLGNKRAVSPLISSILLIAFAVALGVLVMSWGQSTTAFEAVNCDKASLGVVEVDKPMVCLKENLIIATLENEGDIGLSGMRLAILGESGVDNVDADIFIGIGDISEVKADYDTGVGKIKRIKFIPKIYVFESEKLCAKRGVAVTEFSVC